MPENSDPILFTLLSVIGGCGAHRRLSNLEHRDADSLRMSENE